MKPKKEEVNPSKEISDFFRVGASTRSSGNIPTGHFELDYILHYGTCPSNVDISSDESYNAKETLGLPLGKVVEIFGEEGVGKSSLAYRVCGYAQKMNYRVVWIDCENSFSEDLAEINDVDKDSMIFSDMVNSNDEERLFYAEDVFDNIVLACKQNADKKNKPIGVIVLDSVANLVPKSRMEADAEKMQVGVIARLMSENLKKIVNYAAKYNVLVICINQIRDKVGVMFGNPETTPGGRALKYAASVRLRIGRGKEEITRKDEKGNDVLIGRKTNVVIKKNRFAKPYSNSIRIPIYYERYFPNSQEVLFDVARQLKVVKLYKEQYRWKTGDIATDSINDFFVILKDKNLFNDFVTEVKEEAEKISFIVPPEVNSIFASQEDAEANVEVAESKE